MKEIWLNLKTWNKNMVTEAIESGIDAILIHDDSASAIRELGRIKVIAPRGGDLSMPDDVELITIESKDDENRAAASLRSKIVVVRTTDWNIIPIENLIPVGGERLFTFVRNADDARLAAGIMEKGVAGIVLETDDPASIAETASVIRSLISEQLSLMPLTVTSVKNIGMGDRVCVDTCTNLNMGEGLLTGNASSCMFLVHAENIENPYVAPRPFRINAGAVHAYVRVPGNKTRYLGELATGDPVLITDKSGATYTAFVGRSKIEKRPMLVIYAKDDSGTEHSVILQNAETIRLTGVDGSTVSVAVIKEGDRVLGLVEEGGRHFGMSVKETITEK
jgi:3-dehydroquinate synthase II